MKKQTTSESAADMIWKSRERAAEADRKKANEEHKAKRHRADIVFATMEAVKKVEQRVLRHGWLMAAYAVAVKENGDALRWLIKKIDAVVDWEDWDDWTDEPFVFMSNTVLASAKALNKRLEQEWGKNWGKVNAEREVAVRNESALNKLTHKFVALLRWSHGVSEVQTNLGQSKKGQKTWCRWTAAGEQWIATMYKPKSSDPYSKATLIIERSKVKND